jgi:MFS family permease
MNQTTQGTVDAWGDQWMRFFWRTPPADLGERCRRRVALHLIPFLFFLYILAYLDRTNISAAAGAMEASVAEGGLGFSRSTIALASGMFFWGYLILEVPSTIFVERFGVRYVFVRILVLWGITATLMGYVGMPAVMDWIFGWLPSSLPTETSVPFLGTVNEFINSLKTSSENQLHVLRFMLGFFEGGFFPCVIVYLGHWFRPQDRAKAIATFMAAIPFTSVIGYPVSYLILQYMHNVYGLAGWRWVFILEGIVPIFAGIATLFMLPARPHQSAWLPDD